MDINSSNKNYYFPSQKLSKKQKNKDWYQRCVDAAEQLIYTNSSKLRSSYQNKITNYNLANGIIDERDRQKVCNPLGIAEASFPAKMQNYPIAMPKIDLLVGEERKRVFDWQVAVINPDAVSKKEEDKKELLFSFIQSKISERFQRKQQLRAQELQQQVSQHAEEIQNQAMQELQQSPSSDYRAKIEEIRKSSMQEAMQKVQAQEQEKLNAEIMESLKYMKYEYKDIKETLATHILKHLYVKLNLDDLFSRGFEDALIAAEEIYCTDIIADEPIIRKVNPLNIATFGGGESPFIDDSDIIIEILYKSVGQILDDYHDYLTDAEVKQLDEGSTGSSNDGFINIGEREPSFITDGLINTNSSISLDTLNGFWDFNGNIRVIRILWKSYQKIGKLRFFDENGMPQERFVPESYKINKEAGEEIKWMWVNEWHEGTKIGENTYVKMQKRPVQFRSMGNISKCSSGYTGMIYNINSSMARSLMDKMKPYQYLYDVFMYRTELAFAKAKGRIGNLELSRVPDGWDVDKWLYYAETHGWAVSDAFKESKKGASQGKLAGQMTQSTPVLDMELGNYIQQHIMILQFLESQIGEIAGVSKQRQGQIEQRELVGNVSRAITQSAHITEKWFEIHNYIKRNAMELLLETAKYAYSSTLNPAIQYITDDLSHASFQLDMEKFKDADYGIKVVDTYSETELKNAFKNLAQAGIQNDKLNFSHLMDIYSTHSLSSVRRKIETFEEQRAQQHQQEISMQQQMKEREIQAMLQKEEKNQFFELEKMRMQHVHEMNLERMRSEYKIIQQSKDLDNDGIPDVVEVEKIKSIERISEKDRDLKEKLELQKLELEKKKLDILKMKPKKVS